MKTDKLSKNLTLAKNTITQRMHYPGCAGVVTVCGSGLQEGDYAGICALQGCYGFVGITRRDGKLCLVVLNTEPGKDFGEAPSEKEEVILTLEEDTIRLKLEADFTNMRDTASFYYYKKRDDKPWMGHWEKVGNEQKLRFGLDHFTGCRFGLTMYSTVQTDGFAQFSDFVYCAR